MSGESSTEEVFEGVVGPNGDGVLVMGPEISHVNDDLSSGVVGEASQFESGFDGSGDKDAAATDDSSDQDSSYVQVDRVETSNDSVHTDSDDIKTTDDAGKEDMFVDAPDELGASAQATDGEETAERSVEGARFYEEGGMQSYQLVDEVDHLRSTLEKVIAENNALYREKQEERVSSMKEIEDIRCHIKALTGQHQLVDDVNDRSIDNLHEGEEEDTSGTEIPLSKYIRECSEYLKRAMEGRSHGEEETRDFHEKLNLKDKEIDDLKAQISQLSMSQESQADISQAQNQNYLYADAVMNQLLSSLSTVVYQGDLVDDSVGAKAAMVESSLSVLIQNYNQIVYDIEQLRQFLSHKAVTGQEDYRTILSATRDELLALRAKEEELIGKSNQLEEEVAKTKTELDQEKAKSGNLREKLSLAVTKGKGLVQQRDSLRQSLAEKTRELEESFGKLQDASRALEASEHRIVELVACENMLTYLQETLSLKDESLAHVEEMLSLANLPENIQFQNLPEKAKWLVDDRSSLEKDSLELHRIKDAMSSFDFPETVRSLDAVSQISWLKESYHLVNSEAIKLQDELARMKEAADIEIHRLTTSLSDVIQEKEFMQMELSDLSEKFEGIVQKDRQLLEERADAVKLLLDGSGITAGKEEDLIDPSSNLPMLIEKYVSRTVEQSSRSVEPSFALTEDLERKITMVYVKDLELTLCLQLLEEDDLERSQFKEQLNELKLASERLAELRDERDSLQKDLSRAEDKVSTLREKLSMAVKKGKGLVQERENMKGNLDEKNQEIEKLKHEIMQLEDKLNGYLDKISNMSDDLERIPQLEAETVSLKDQRDQFEKFLGEIENKLRVVMESIQSITLPNGLVFDDPIEKLKMISTNMSEFEAYKLDSEKELEKVKHEASDMNMKLVEAHSVINSMEDRVFDVKNNLDQVSSKNNELEAERASLEQEVQKLMEEAKDQSAKLLEASVTMKLLRDELSQAKDDAHELSVEKEEANAGRVAAEMELDKAQEEVATQNRKLEEAYTTVRTLEERLSQMAVDISLLTEQNTQMQQDDKSDLESEMQKLKDEINSQAEELANTHSTIKLMEDAMSKTEDEKKIANEEILTLSSKLAEAYETIKALENAKTHLEARISPLTEENNEGHTTRLRLEGEIQILKEEISSLEADLADTRSTMKSFEDAAADAKTNMSVLADEKRAAEAMVSESQTKLNACLEEQSGTHGNIQSRYMELISCVKDLQMLATNDPLAPWRHRFQVPLENLKSMDLVLEDIRNRFEEIGQSAQLILGNSLTGLSTAEFLTDVPSIDISGMTSEEVDEVNKLFIEVTHQLHRKDKYISENLQGFCTILDTFTEAVLLKLQSSKNEISGLVDHMESLKKTIDELEFGTQERNNTIATLEKDFSVFASVSAEAEEHLLQLCSTTELEFESWDVEAESDYKIRHEKLVNDRYAEIAKNLSLATQKVHNLVMQLINTKSETTATISGLQNELTMARSSLEQLRMEKELSISTISKLEADLQASQTTCVELSLEIENRRANEEILIKKEAEVSALYSNLLSKEQGTKDSHVSASELKELLDKASGVDFPFEEPKGLIPSAPTLLKKLGIIIDNFSELQHKLVLLSQDKQKQESTIGQQMSEMRHLQEEILEHSKNIQDSQKVKNEFSDFALQLERVIRKLGGAYASENQTPEEARRLLSVVDKLVETLLLEYENSKSEVRQLRDKLLEGQKVVDNLAMKVQSLEELIQNQKSMPQSIQERNFVDPGSASEITEVEDVDLSGKSTITPVPSAAQMRTFRKGSTDHLALNIDTESAPLISNVGTDEDKGHVFKSLNTTGLIPKQGKTIADRMDGYWVNGGRFLMNQPRARLGVMAYWLVLHLWLLASIL